MIKEDLETEKPPIVKIKKSQNSSFSFLIVSGKKKEFDHKIVITSFL